ncbi:MAG: thioredoxin domain-containing protein [Candidatus Woesearchaeota archaeon]
MEPATALLFTSMTCPHCPHAKKVFEKVKGERRDSEFHNLLMNDPQAQLLAQKFNVRSVPTFIFYGPGHETPMGLVGVQSIETINKYLDIAKGKREFIEKNTEKKPLLKRLFKK